VLALGVLLYAGEVDLADALIFIASAAAAMLLGIYVPRPEPPQTLTEGRDDAITQTTEKQPVVQSSKKDTDSDGASGLRTGEMAGAVAVAVVVLAACALLSLLPSATADAARWFQSASLVFIVVAGGLTVAAFTGPAAKRQGLRQKLVAGAVLTAVLAFISSTASGLVVDRFTSHPTGPSPVATVKNYFSPTVRPPSVKNYFSPKVAAPTVKVELGSECTVYLVHLDELVDDEPHIAEHLPGKSFPLDQGARACGFKRASEVDAIAAVLAAR
jgi:hypothetical protein